MLSAGSFRAPKPLRVQCQTCLTNCSRARSTCFVERNRLRARRRSSVRSSKTPLPESPKRRKDLFCRLKWDCLLWASLVLLMGIPKACSPRHYEYSGLSAKSSQTLRIQWFERQELPGITDCLLCLPCLFCLPRMRHPQSSTTCRAKLGRAKRGQCCKPRPAGAHQTKAGSD